MTSHYCQRLEACRQEIMSGEPGAKDWCRDQVHSFDDLMRVIRAITDAMTAAGLSEDDIYSVRQGLQEGLLNANKHGHQGDWSRPIRIRYFVSPAGVVAEIEDQGAGFDPSQVPNPLAPENLERPGGRGLLMMRTLLSGICHNEQGNCICLCKHRGGAAPPQIPSEEATVSSTRELLDKNE